MQEPAPKSHNNENTLKQELISLNKNLASLTRANRKRNVIMRGILNGVFTALGASLGFGFFLVLFSGVLEQAESVPLLDRIIESSKIEPIINKYLEEISRPTPEPTITPSPTLTPSPTPTLAPTETPKPTVIRVTPLPTLVNSI